MEPERAGGRWSFGKGDPAESPGKAFPGDGTAEKIRRTVRAGGRAISEQAI